MKKIIYAAFLLFMAPSISSAGPGFSVGEEFIGTSISSVKGSGNYSIGTGTQIYFREKNDDDTWSSKETDWQLKLKDKKGKILDSAYLIFWEGSSASADCVKIPCPKVKTKVYKMSRINFKNKKSATHVELYFKGKIKAKEKIKRRNFNCNDWPEYFSGPSENGCKLKEK